MAHEIKNILCVCMCVRVGGGGGGSRGGGGGRGGGGREGDFTYFKLHFHFGQFLKLSPLWCCDLSYSGLSLIGYLISLSLSLSLSLFVFVCILI